MKTYRVTRRRGRGLASEMPGTVFPVYRIAASSAKEAKKIACRLDRQDERFAGLYMVAAEKKRQSAATDRRWGESRDTPVVMETKNIIAQAPMKCKRGLWL